MAFVQVFGQIAEHKKHVAVDELESILKDNKEALILDLGAGTGIIGQMVDLIYKMQIPLLLSFMVSVV